MLEAKSVLLQVCLSLATAERAFHFEHRDLHWGNILVSPTAIDRQQYMLEDRFFSIDTHGVNATIIDYTISRLDHGRPASLFSSYHSLSGARSSNLSLSSSGIKTASSFSLTWRRMRTTSRVRVTTSTTFTG